MFAMVECYFMKTWNNVPTINIQILHFYVNGVCVRQWAGLRFKMAGAGADVASFRGNRLLEDEPKHPARSTRLSADNSGCRPSFVAR